MCFSVCLIPSPQGGRNFALWNLFPECCYYDVAIQNIFMCLACRQTTFLSSGLSRLTRRALRYAQIRQINLIMTMVLYVPNIHCYPSLITARPDRQRLVAYPDYIKNCSSLCHTNQQIRHPNSSLVYNHAPIHHLDKVEQNTVAPCILI